MSDEELGDPGYTDREMRLIFERAGELELLPGRERRYSIGEIQAMGKEAGLDADDIARAAISVRVASTRHRLLGAPTRFRGATSVDGKLSETGLADVVAKLRDATGRHGEVRTVPGGVEWRARGPLGAYIVDFAPRHGSTRIDLLVARDDQAVLTAIGAAFVGLGAGALAGVAVGAQLHAGLLAGFGAGAAAGVAAMWASARVLWTRAARRWSARAESVTAVVAEAAKVAARDEHRTDTGES